MTATVICRACGAQPRAEARFCDACGARIEAPAAEYKQVTVLFADVVRSMDLASTLDAEQLREIMTDLFDRSAAIVQHYGGTVDKFTGDRIMAVFGAPISLEDHAFRACLAALEIQRDVGGTLKLRIGLNSGQVIAGEIGSSTANYTTIGEQVGMAQRMEAAAPSGGVMLSESTARLTRNLATLGEPERVHVKNVDEPVHARRLLGVGEHQTRRLNESRLVGRNWELNAVSALLDEVLGGVGCVSASWGRPASVRAGWFVKPSPPPPPAASRCSAPTASPNQRHPVSRRRTILARGDGVDKLEADAAREKLRAGLPPPTAKTSFSSMTCSGFVTPRSHCPRLPRMHCGDV